jgi:ATP-binding cassette, subfamily B, bacterial PglK
MIDIYKKIFILFSNSEKKKFKFLVFLMIVMAFIEVVGVSSIMPFLAVLGNPQLITENEYIFYFYNLFNLQSEEKFLIFLGGVAIFILTLSAIFKIITYYYLHRFSNMRRHSIGKKLLIKYLHQPYSFFLRKASGDISKNILSETDIVVSQVINSFLMLITYGIITLFLIIFLVSIDYKLAAILGLVFGGFYFFMYITIRKYLARIGKERQKSNGLRYKVTSETIGGIKDLKIFGKEEVYLNSFDEPSIRFSNHAATAQILSIVPQFLVEALAFGMILSMAMYALNNNGSDLGNLLPILGLYALGALKLKPAINTIYSSISNIRFASSSLDEIISDLNKPDKEISMINSNKRLAFKEKIDLLNIDFNYEGTNKKSLKSINLSIDAKTTVGFIGKTGSGKSTLIDIILGLLDPTNGSIKIDGKILNKFNKREWQNIIGYVPQTIFLIDDSISSNIAFGIEKGKIDNNKVIEVAKIAQLHEFVINLDEGYDVQIGERGVRLSGGQRQRLGIARALYHDPELLVLDEATSALDTKTEEEVMNAINKMSGKNTIIIIAHRISTVEKCDMVVTLEDGKIINVKRKI